MHRITLSALVLGVPLACLLHAAPAAAQAKIWVANGGTDSGACGDVAAPCRTFQQAHDNVAAGGEIGVLTPGDYGRATLRKSISVTNDGTGEASVLAGSNQNGIEVNAARGDVVGLRGLIIDGQVFGGIGILIDSASAVHIQNCVIRNFEHAGSGYGILMGTVVSTQIFISDTIIYNNGSTAATGGIVIMPFDPGSANVVLVRVHLENNVRGLWADGRFSAGSGIHAVLRDSVVSGNAGDGVLATAATGTSAAFLIVERSSIVNNAGTGIRADGPHATMLLHGNAVARNGIGISATNSGQLISYGDNRVNNNLGADGVPTGSYSPI